MSARSSSARWYGHTGQAAGTGAAPLRRCPAEKSSCTGWAGSRAVRWGTARSGRRVPSQGTGSPRMALPSEVTRLMSAASTPWAADSRCGPSVRVPCRRTSVSTVRAAHATVDLARLARTRWCARRTSSSARTWECRPPGPSSSGPCARTSRCPPATPSPSVSNRAPCRTSRWPAPAPRWTSSRTGFGRVGQPPGPAGRLLRGAGVPRGRPARADRAGAGRPRRDHRALTCRTAHPDPAVHRGGSAPGRRLPAPGRARSRRSRRFLLRGGGREPPRSGRRGRRTGRSSRRTAAPTTSTGRRPRWAASPADRDGNLPTARGPFRCPRLRCPQRSGRRRWAADASAASRAGAVAAVRARGSRHGERRSHGTRTRCAREPAMRHGRSLVRDGDDRLR